MEPQAWGYYSSGGDDEITLRDNHMAGSCIMQSLLRSRELHPLGPKSDWTTSMPCLPFLSTTYCS